VPGLIKCLKMWMRPLFWPFLGTDHMPVRRHKEDIIHSVVSPEQSAYCSCSSLCMLAIKVLHFCQSSIR
jgi:hypothetical protein